VLQAFRGLAKSMHGAGGRFQFRSIGGVIALKS
jgi:hypothetical protein